MNNEILDKELGHIVFVESSRAKRLIARKMPDYIKVTIPDGYSIKKAMKLLIELKPKLLTLKAKDIPQFYVGVEFKTLTFVLKLETNNSLLNYYMNLKDGVLSITCPLKTDFKAEETQGLVRHMIEKALRYEAKRIFPAKVAQIAEAYNFQFTEVKINKSKTRWGSCSSKKNINLSCICMLLPEYLIDFIIKHELCHTIEMNHSDKFWTLLDSVSNNEARKLTKELKEYKIYW
ncbi:M48 family metallopeptidase [Dysgonomonas sp. 520]|uniref:M48 family metallopeptidase n=1 Tax=Dysgonomonas sp. 520 TaxID=2302931 RepID=UPI0013D47B40|nr:M48 family metallopeptidase [Dysgonomonas sp. 520]NDW09162.1 M48 family peptidase [Dysgonomonas sp. 520]